MVVMVMMMMAMMTMLYGVFNLPVLHEAFSLSYHLVHLHSSSYFITSEHHTYLVHHSSNFPSHQTSCLCAPFFRGLKEALESCCFIFSLCQTRLALGEASKSYRWVGEMEAEPLLFPEAKFQASCFTDMVLSEFWLHFLTMQSAIGHYSSSNSQGILSLCFNSHHCAIPH